jgi:hypothetical protein
LNFKCDILVPKFAFHKCSLRRYITAWNAAAMSPLTGLRWLDLSDNSGLSTLPSGAFTGYTALENLDISGTGWGCRLQG